MKAITTKLLIMTSAIAFMSVMLMLSSCSGDDSDPITPDQQMLTNLKNGGIPWSLVSVTKDGYDVADEFTGFALLIGDFTYNTQNGVSSAWPASGTWQFYNGNINVMLRNDGVLINSTIVNNQLILKFTVTGVSEGGRVEGVDGEYHFVMQNQ
jgi:hypothetical protein